MRVSRTHHRAYLHKCIDSTLSNVQVGRAKTGPLIHGCACVYQKQNDTHGIGQRPTEEAH